MLNIFYKYFVKIPTCFDLSWSSSESYWILTFNNILANKI